MKLQFKRLQQEKGNKILEGNCNQEQQQLQFLSSQDSNLQSQEDKFKIFERKRNKKRKCKITQRMKSYLQNIKKKLTDDNKRPIARSSNVPSNQDMKIKIQNKRQKRKYKIKSKDRIQLQKQILILKQKNNNESKAQQMNMKKVVFKQDDFEEQPQFIVQKYQHGYFLPITDETLDMNITRTRCNSDSVPIPVIKWRTQYKQQIQKSNVINQEIIEPIDYNAAESFDDSVPIDTQSQKDSEDQNIQNKDQILNINGILNDNHDLMCKSENLNLQEELKIGEPVDPMIFCFHMIEV